MTARLLCGRLLFISACLLLVACGPPILWMGTVSPSERLPVDPLAAAFLSNPAFENARISPDGQRIAAIRSHGATDEIVLASGPDWSRIESVVVEKRGDRGLSASRAIRTLGWAGNDVLVYSIETPLRSPEDGVPRVRGRGHHASIYGERGRGTRLRKTRLYRANLDRANLDGQTHYLADHWADAPYSQYQDEVVDWLPNEPEHLIIAYDENAVRINVTNGARRTLARGGEVTTKWRTDHRGVVRGRIERRDWTRRQTLFVRRSGEADWIELIGYDPYEEDGFDLAGFSPDPDRLYVYSDLESDRAELYEYDLEQRRMIRRIAADPVHDMDSGRLLLSQTDGRLLAIEWYGERLQRKIVDPDFARAWLMLEKLFPDCEIRILGRSASEDRWLLQISADTRPPEIHVFEPQRGHSLRVFEMLPDLRDIALAPMQSVRYTARDGLPIHGYLTRPIGTSGPGPLVVLPHDGPEGRDVWGFDPVVQFLVARGYSVFQPNYRGSTGYGGNHSRKGFGEWGGAMQEDVIDGLRALIDRGVADPDRIAIVGTGYGGYVPLVASAKTPDLLRAGASLSGVTNLDILLGRGQRSVGQTEVFEKLIGPRFRDRDRLEDASPSERADAIRVPVLIGHGSEDPTVHIDHLRVMARALADAGVEFEAVAYDGQTHRFLDDRLRVDFYGRLARFLDRHLVAGE